jgi:hypothetical protein
VTALGLSSIGVPKAELAFGFRGGWLRRIGVAVGGASGAAIVLGAYEVLRSQPDRAFALLQGWGPTFLIVIVALCIVGNFLEGLNATVRESFNVVAAGVQNSAEAAGRTADALTRLAEQGGEQARETQRLATFAAQESQNVYERLDQQDEVLGQLMKSMNTIQGRLFDRTRGESDGIGSGT